MSTSSILFDSIMIPYAGFIIPQNMNLNASAYVYSPCLITNISIKNDDTVGITAQLNEGVEDQIKNKPRVLSVDKRNAVRFYGIFSLFKSNQMKTGYIKTEIEDFKNAGNEVTAFYVTYKETENIKSQKWGKIYELDTVLDEIEKCETCIQNELPIERLIIFAKGQAMVFCQNKCWNCVEDESEDSHFIVCVPYIAEDGMFGRIESNYKNGEYAGPEIRNK